MAEAFYGNGVSNGATAYGNELAIAFAWRDGTGTLTKTVSELIAMQDKAVVEALAFWKARPK